MYSELAVPAVQKAMHIQLIAWLINNSAWLLPIPALVYAAVLSDKVIKLQLAEILPRHQHLWCLVLGLFLRVPIRLQYGDVICMIIMQLIT